MKEHFLLLMFSFSLIVLNSCCTKTTVSKYESGIIELEKTECKSQTTYFHYDSIGVLFEEFTTNKDSVLNGEYKTYFQNGQLKKLSHYQNDILNGEVIGYYENGVKSFLKTMINGLSNGQELGWYENGQLSYEYYCEKGLAQGCFMMYYDTGEPLHEWHYRNDTPIGKSLKFSKLGDTLSYMLFNDSGKVIESWFRKKNK
ncbi:MAG: hypothetical protein KDC92_04120 [Bacteroidetes bacterium]|nr:hypothetical protein [Bacteroidota bacterium]